MDRGNRRRSQSQVRLKEPEIEQDSDGSLVDGWYVHRPDGRVDFVPDDKSNKRYTARHRDLENKTAPRNKDFRARRDGYESEEGETHKRAKSVDRQDDPGDYRRDRQANNNGPRGGRPRDYESQDDRPRDYASQDDRPRDARPRNARPRDARPRDARPRDDRPRDYDPRDAGPRDYDPRNYENRNTRPRDDEPRDTRSQPGESLGTAALGAGVGAAAGAAVATGAAKKLGQNRNRPPQDYDSRPRDYDSRPRRDYDSGRPRNPRDYSPSQRPRRRSSLPPQPASSRNDRQRPRRRNDSYSPPPRRDRDPGSRRDDATEKKDWKKQAGSFLVATAVPLIKKHGERYLKDQVERRFK